MRDTFGNLVDRVEVPISDEQIKWAGVDAAGDPIPPGTYSFFLQSYADDVMLGEEQIAVYSEVVEARMDNGQTKLILAGGGEIMAADVDAMRRPGG